ncbi:MAG TPA: His/Gly/Thr/Pro-type tRNA ligase C-terminal domain-containing protein, partial [Candidatus Saccharimonadales bacterium]|nr:His/Gly/Thr/Pro-type tRNA ligase C-terminal domain-containing protein [Candidatus Saccharimonadales bacterium]
KTIRNAYGGANKDSVDLKNINLGRDFTPDIEADIALAQPGFISPDGNPLIERKGVEVGNIFQLGYHYTKLMQGAEYTDEQGKRQQYYMGCYGIGIGRTLATIVETHRDERGIVWPENIAPFRVYLASIGESDAVVQQGEEIYKALTDAGVAVLYDDRLEARAGEKFADADLLGLPYRLVVSDKTLAGKQFELKKRTSKETQMLDQQAVINLLTKA